MRQLDLQWLPREPGLQRRLLYGEMIRRHYGLSRFHPQNTIRSLNTRIPRLYDNYEQIRPVVSIFQQSFTPRHTPRFIEENTGCSMKSVFQNSKVSLDSFNLCSICLNPGENDITRELICKHKFHLNCIDQWLMKRNQCPLCRTALG